MSYKCDNCGAPQPDNTQPTRAITKTRRKVYPQRFKKVDYGPPIVIDNGGKGWEIVSEQSLCPSCFMAYEEMSGR